MPPQVNIYSAFTLRLEAAGLADAAMARHMLVSFGAAEKTITVGRRHDVVVAVGHEDRLGDLAEVVGGAEAGFADD